MADRTNSLFLVCLTERIKQYDRIQDGHYSHRDIVGTEFERKWMGMAMGTGKVLRRKSRAYIRPAGWWCMLYGSL